MRYRYRFTIVVGRAPRAGARGIRADGSGSSRVCGAMPETRRAVVSLCAACALVLAARWWVRRRRRRGGWRRPLGVLHKSTFAVRDPSESVAFCVKYLGCAEIAVPDPGLVARGIRWARLPGGTRAAPASEFHFIPWGVDSDTGLMGGIDTNGDG